MSIVSIREKKYLFVDSGNFLRYFRETVERWAGAPPDINYAALASAYGAQKAFFYDCINDIQNPTETAQDFRARLEAQEQEFAKISSGIGTHVRLGSMTGTYKNRRQKEVDILLAVDVLKHAARRNMDTAILMSGDGDFRPLIEALIEMGLFAWVVSDVHHTSRELRLAADRYEPLRLRDYYQWVTKEFREKFPLPFMIYGSAYMNNEGFLHQSDGVVGVMKAKLFNKGNTIGVMVFMEDEQPLNITSESLNRLQLFCELNYGTMKF